MTISTAHLCEEPLFGEVNSVHRLERHAVIGEQAVHTQQADACKKAGHGMQVRACEGGLRRLLLQLVQIAEHAIRRPRAGQCLEGSKLVNALLAHALPILTKRLELVDELIDHVP
eukprot:scaffold132407_cov33-Tisochrysis_lutea.AAC.3